MMPAPYSSTSAKDRLWLALQAHEGTWQTVERLMSDAGFIPTPWARLTPYTSFYFNLCQLKDAGPSNGYKILHDGDGIVLCRRGLA